MMHVQKEKIDKLLSINMSFQGNIDLFHLQIFDKIQQ